METISTPTIRTTWTGTTDRRHHQPRHLATKHQQRTLVNPDKVAAGVHLILEAIGENPNREGLKETPARVARMYQELFSAIGVDASKEITCVFHEDIDDPIIVRDIHFSSVCEHHLVPFFGMAQIAYIPENGCITGLSKLARVVELTARRPQVQERMTNEIADALVSGLNPRGVAVILEAEHLCMSMRGVKKPGAKTITQAVRGVFKTDPAARAELLAHIQKT